MLSITVGELTSYRLIGIMVRVFTTGPEDRGSIPGRVLLKTQKMILNASLLTTQYFVV